MQGGLKEMTLARMSELVIKDSRLPVLLDRCAVIVHSSCPLEWAYPQTVT